MPDRPFSRHQRGDFQPAQCVATGRDTDLIDIGAPDIPNYGRVYVSTLLIAEIAQSLGFVDGAITAQQQNVYQQQLQELRDALAAEKAKDITRIVTKLERQANAIRTTADDILRGLPARGDSGVLASAAAGTPALGGPEDVPVSGDGVEGPAGGSTGGIVGAADSGQPEPVREDVGDSDLGGDPESGVDPEVDGPDLDASFGWLERGAEEGTVFDGLDGGATSY